MLTLDVERHRFSAFPRLICLIEQQRMHSLQLFQVFAHSHSCKEGRRSFRLCCISLPVGEGNAGVVRLVDLEGGAVVVQAGGSSDKP